MNRRLRILLKLATRLKKEDGCLDTPCWVWQGPHSGNGRGGGYGRVQLDGATMAVHRVMWTVINGPIPHKKQIDHECCNRRCANPGHLTMVTHRQNQRRRRQRG